MYLMDQAFTNIKTETFMKVNSKMERSMDKEYYFIKIKNIMKDYGLKINLYVNM